MLYDNLRRGVSLVLALVMVFSLVPVSALATETEPSVEAEAVADPTVATEPVTTVPAETEAAEVFAPDAAAETETEASEEISEPSEETTYPEAAPAERLTQEMDKILLKYLGATVLTEDEVIDIVNTMFWVDMEQALVDCNALEPMIDALSETELAELETTYTGTNTIVCFYETLQLAMTPGFFASTGNWNPCTGVNVEVSGATDCSHSSGTVIVTAKGSGGLFGIGAYTKTATITVKNDSGSTATVAFKWTATSVNELKIDGTKYTAAEGDFSKVMDSGTSFTITITTAKNGTTNKLELKDFKCISADAVNEVTFEWDSALGSFTVDGGTLKSNPIEVPAAGIALVASTANGSEFVGWMDTADNRLLSAEKSFQLVTDKSMTVRAVFAKGTPWFYVKNGNNDYLYEGWSNAMAKAEAASSKTAVLANNVTLSNGEYVVPETVKLLVPFSKANLLCVSNSTDSAYSNSASPSTFRTLTVSGNATIVCNGELHVAGQRKTSGQPTTGTTGGKHGKIVLNGSGTQLKIGSKGTLYCFGYITGSGTVEMENGSNARELIQVCDWPGGTNALGWLGAGNDDTFLSTRYFVQNIEAPFKVNYGATVYIEAVLNVSSAVTPSSSAVITKKGSSQGLFLLGEGTYLLRTYDAQTDRVQYSLNGSGEVDFGSIKVTVSIASMDSSKYILPINNALTVSVGDGVTMNMGNKSAIIPGAKVIVDGVLNLTNHLYIFDKADWLDSMSFGTQKALPYTAGRGTTAKLAVDESGSLTVNGTLNITGNGGIYTTNSGTDANKVIKGTGTIVHNGTLGKGSINVGYSSTRAGVSVTDGLANLAGFDTMQSLKNGGSTYYGLGPDHNHYWYQGEPKVEAPTCTKEGKTTYTCNNATGEPYVVTSVIDPNNHTEAYTSDVLPTYDKAGTIGGKHCSECSAVLEAPQEIPAAQVGDITYLILKEAIAAADRHNNVVLLSNINGDVPVGKHVTIEKGSYTANIVADTGFALAENGTATTVLIKIVATNMAASDGLDLFFYVNSDTLTDPEGYIARVTRTYADGTANEMDVALTGYNATLTRFCYEAIAAKEMTDTVTGTLYYKDGTPASNSYTESVKSYAMRTLAAQESGSKLIPALVDMLNYGAGAQGHFGYATDNLANADEAFSAYTGTTENVTLKDQLVKGNNIVATSVSAKNKLMMTFYFQNITQQMSAKISYTDHYGKEITYTIPGEKFYPYNSWYGVDVVGVPVANGRALITCEVYDGDTLIGSAADSVEGYSARTAEKGYAVAGVMQQLMRFVDSAAAYFQSIK